MYKHWGEKFYPEDLKDSEKLAYISRHYGTLEVNTSFYHFVRKSVFAKWYGEAPEGFVFSVKAPRYYTHLKRLKLDEEVTASLERFFDSIEALEEKLGAVLFQLPASFKAYPERLDAFLDAHKPYVEKMKNKPDIAFEFRHDSWFTEETYDVLKKHNVALVIANSSRYPYEIRTTADFSYMRFHGPETMFLGKYTEEELLEWKKEIRKFSKPLRKVYIYFNNDLEANAVENADYLVEAFKKETA